MSDYTKSTDFASKDSLPSGNAAKIVKGTEIDTEFNNIATAIATKADLASPSLTGSPTAPTQSTGDSSTKLATTAFVAAALSALYPVGSIYTNASVSTNPATLLGFGTWTAFGAGRVLVGIDGSDSSFDTAGETGGSKDATVVSHTHTASTSSSGSHQHESNGTNIRVQIGLDGGTAYSGYTTSSNSTNITTTPVASAGSHTHSVTVNSTGSSGTNANLQPYIVVYMWRRTA
jgi:hypothetical protein